VPDSWLTVAFDQHADQLYIYSRFLLREPHDAADAVARTFLVAAARLADLPDAELTRPWLFALIRNECLRQIRSGRAAPATSRGIPGPESGLAASGPDPALLRAAIRGLALAETDVLGLFWHGLDVSEIAEVLDLPRYDTLTLFSRARDELETSVARPGQLSAAGLSSVQLSLTPGALLGAAITPEGLRYAGRVTSAIRDQLLAEADAATEPDPAAHRMARRAGPFRGNGFPKPVSTGPGRKPRRATLAAVGAAAVAAAAALAVIGVRTAEQGSARTGLDAQAKQTGAALIVPSLAASAPASPTFSAATPSPSASPSASASASPSPSPSPSPTSPAASPSATRTSARPSSSPSPSAGKLMVSPTTVTASQGNPGSLTLTATGGAVSWSVTSSARHLSLSQTSGTLQSGQSVTITITATRWTFSGGTLTVTGGGQSQQVTVNGG
jgi:DNA-directed RNA polymerase specialized sigma24 family protein